MKSKFLLMPLMIMISPFAVAADSGERSSPLDNNPGCMDRSKDASSPECTPQTEGQPRHYVQPVKPTAPPVKKPVTPPPPPVERLVK